MTLAEALARGRQLLAGGDSPALDTQLLLQHVSGATRVQLLAYSERLLTANQQQHFLALLARRQQGEPIAHLLGEQEFYGLPLAVNAHTLIPRADTETLVDAALVLPDSPRCFLDLGTGTGAIAIALAYHRRHWQGVAVERIAAAAELAERNVARHQVAVTVLHGSWFAPVAGQRFGLIVANPPYIDPADPHLHQGDVRFEPRSALTADDAGLADLRHIITAAPDYLEPAGWLMLEHGYDQAEAVSRLLVQQGFTQVRSIRDLGGNQRVSLGCWQDNAGVFG